ncbi:DNA translocase [Kluyveromyces lactis]|uniref:KLLA0F24838p n=1 Tax=Kluyveromyces lactis (strain ATCC 8585 / CBS 2359 / DSM 70799 / NBRC 1267 / NRRL Y-1140 / WM37) TaxID=284590 RepID=Q6CIQ3_KLULA|nr:uncharacterized protein KLLA0_F24838g [Kluyveromyces lactis]CAG98894.1 KLLA0F24838p [Kluyveromyces lactis]|eukprot:XP_456186.1 uncharacterized protein KLLA0_F24838g [Kluyveromyces lactis]
MENPVSNNQHDEKYWSERRSKFLLDVDPKIAKQRNKEDTYIRFKHLLQITDLFRHFIGIRAKYDKNMQKLLKTIDAENKVAGTLKEPAGHLARAPRHYRKTEQEEDAELMEDEEVELEEDTTILTQSPSFIKEGKLRDYQVYGLNWLISLHESKLSGILADEMGLGKTLQSISFLGYLRYIKGIEGPYIVIVPKSTLDNWQREFAKWTPEVKTVILQGDKDFRKELIETKILTCNFDVLITSYEMVLKEKLTLKRFAWEYILIDEAHRIKNEQSALSQVIRLFYSKNRLLITGTPLQNNLHELWALLNFLLPDVFGDSEVFDEWFQQNGKEEDQEVVVQQLHSVLQPFLLRRVKSEVEKSLLPKKEINLYVGMTDMQIEWYKSLLEKDIDAVNGAVGKREGKTRLLNIVMQLRKCCNHPYLFEGAEPGPPYTTDEHLVFNSGKMIVLDKLLKKKKEQGSRVLIFSQMSRLLDILEDYCYFRGYEYCRIDGSTSHDERVEAIDEYNKPNSEKFIFLLTTRAGGLGINLVTADTVVLYDSDWNPQADLQAMDRAHRIGQKKQVFVYRFVTENAIEEKVIERAAQKLRLDQLVIQQGTGKKTSALTNNKDDLIDMIQFGARDMLQHGSGNITVDEDIDEILKKGERKTLELNAKYESLGLDDLQKFNGMADQSAYEWNGTNFEKKKPDDHTVDWINPPKRERRREQPLYSVDDYYREVIGNGKSKPSGSNTPALKLPKQPKVIRMTYYQFAHPEFVRLQELEQLWYKKSVGYKITAYDVKEHADESEGDDDDEEDSRSDGESDDTNNAQKQEDDIDAKIAEEQAKIDAAEEFTDENLEQKQRFLEESFYNWNKREFLAFISACIKFGRDNYVSISKAIHTKTPEEVQRYSETFWKRYKEVQGWEKYVANIEAGEKKTEKLKIQETILKQKLQQYQYPLVELKILYPPNNTRRTYNSLEDIFLLVTVGNLGLFASNLYERVKQEILKSPLFIFSWFIKTRTPLDISKRIATLLTLVQREHEGVEHKRKRKTVTSADDQPNDSHNLNANVVSSPPSKRIHTDKQFID